MDHPIGLLVPWLVFAVAIALKAWKFGRLINNRWRPQLGATARDMDRFRAQLELGWQRSQLLR